MSANEAAVVVVKCKACDTEFERIPSPGRPREYCFICRPPGSSSPAVQVVPIEGANFVEAEAARQQADELDREADLLAEVVRSRRAEAAKLRARADRLEDPSLGAMVKRPVSPLQRVRNDGLLAAAGLAVEDLLAGFEARDLAVALGIADEARASRLLLGLEELDKVTRLAEGWQAIDPEEIRVRDWVVARGDFMETEACAALDLDAIALTYYLDRFRERGMLMHDGGRYTYREPRRDRSFDTRPRRRPPEKEPPAGTLSKATGEPVRIVDHGKRANATSRHREKLRDKRYAEMQQAREGAAEAQRGKAQQQPQGRRRR